MTQDNAVIISEQLFRFMIREKAVSKSEQAKCEAGKECKTKFGNVIVSRPVDAITSKDLDGLFDQIGKSKPKNPSFLAYCKTCRHPHWFDKTTPTACATIWQK